MGKILFNIRYHLRNLYVSEVSAEYLLNKALTVTVFRLRLVLLYLLALINVR